MDTVEYPIGVSIDFSGTVSLFEFRVGQFVLVLASINGVLAKDPAARITLRQLVFAHGVVSTTKAGVFKPLGERICEGCRQASIIEDLQTGPCT